MGTETQLVKVEHLYKEFDEIQSIRRYQSDNQ